jgi:hypothetical protein
MVNSLKKENYPHGDYPLSAIKGYAAIRRDIFQAPSMSTQVNYFLSSTLLNCLTSSTPELFTEFEYLLDCSLS